MEPTTGRQLRVERTAAGLTVNAVVAEMGISRQTMWATERRPIVDPAMVIRYRAAIARLLKAVA